MKAENMKSHSAEAQRLLVRRARGEQLPLRNQMYLVVNEPTSGLWAHVVGAFVWTHVVAYCCLLCLESTEGLTISTGPAPWMWGRLYFNTAFTCEAAVRIFAHIPVWRAARDPTVWLDMLSILPFWIRWTLYPQSVTKTSYLLRSARPMWIRFFESAGNFRLLKLSRNFAGAELLINAISRASRELLIPCFMLAIMTFAFATIMFEIEWDESIYECQLLWRALGLPRTFLNEHPGGPSWDCDVCALQNASGSASGSEELELLDYQCLTCNGYPPGHPECSGMPFAQNFPDPAKAMWYTCARGRALA